MRTPKLKYLLWIIPAALGILLLTAYIATKFKRAQEVDSVTDEQKLARTLGIIRTSTPTDHKVLKVLFYGQSITHSGWHKQVVEHWHQKYPNTVFVVENRAIGGFPAQALLRTTEQDIAAFYPDLIVFHVYGDHRAYEKILRLFRSRTAADVILQTDHANTMPDPPCAEGLQISIHRQAGCSGLFWVTQSIWADEMSYHKIPAYAKKYGFAVEPQRTWWRDYLLKTHIAPESMLKDDIHPNEKGKAMLAGYFNQYFDRLVEHWNGETEHNITSLTASDTHTVASQQTIEFDGSRIELLTTKPLTVFPSVSIDGTPTKDIDGCYQVTRTTALDTAPDWPAIRRITLNHDHTPEDWTATLSHISKDQKSFEIEVTSSLNGDQGTGNAAQVFVSKSGQLSIDPDDWMVERGFEGRNIPLKDPYSIHWSVISACDGHPEAIDLGNGNMQYRYVLATGLAYGKHTATLNPALNDKSSLLEFRIYNPPLHQDRI